MQRKLIGAVAALSLLSFAAFPVQAQVYPTKPVTIVVPFPPGGGPDVLARSIAEKLSPRLGQTVLVENRPGVSGMIGASHVARAAADGHTLMMTPNTVLLAPLVMKQGIASQVDVINDFTPVIEPSRATMVLAVHPSLGVNNAKDLVALLKKSPGSVSYASAGAGSPTHIAGELFKRAANVDMLHVPYKGIAPAITDTVGGQTKVIFSPLGTIAQHLASGRLVAISAASSERSPLMPEMQTLKEQGYRDVEVNAWYGLFAPKGTPASVVDKLNQEVNAILKTPDMAERLKASWETPVGGTSQALGQAAQREYTTFGKIIKDFGISAE